MPLVKRKPVLYTPLPSLSTILQPISSTFVEREESPLPSPSNPPVKLKGKATSGAATATDVVDAEWAPPDSTNEEEQFQRLAAIFKPGVTTGTIAKGKRPGQWIASGSLNLPGVGGKEENGHVEEMAPPGIPESWKITDREVFFIPETGEIFTDYE